MVGLFIAFGVALLVSGLLVRFAPAVLLDYPNERALHHRPVPRGGGLGILAGIAVALVWFAHFRPDLWKQAFVVLFGFAVLLGLFSFIDDLRSLSPLWRLVGQGVLSGVFLKASGWWLREVPVPGFHFSWPLWLGVIVTWLWLVWMVNLYNFMDGMDGFAGGMAVWGFGTLSILSWWAGDKAFSSFCAVVVLASLGFLVWNFPPARIFMGDVGSTALGFLAAGAVLYADVNQRFPFWMGAAAFSPFIADATITLLRRALRRERVWLPHRSHYYQRLVCAGWGHRRTMLVGYITMGVTSLWVLWLFWCQSKCRALGFWALVSGYLALAGFLESKLRKSSG